MGVFSSPALSLTFFLPTLRGANLARVVWQRSYQILKWPVSLIRWRCCLFSTQGGSSIADVRGVSHPLVVGATSASSRSGVKSPMREVERCAVSTTSRLLRTCAGPVFAELHNLSLEELGRVFKRGPEPWRRAFMAGAYYAVPHE